MINRNDEYLKSKIYSLDKDLRIGLNCVSMNYSGLLELNDMMYLALYYTLYEFIYNVDGFTSFINALPPEENISKENPLILVGKTGSVFLRDYYAYIDQSIENSAAFSINSFDINMDLKEVKKQFLDKDIPVIFPCDIYYFYDDYKRLNANMLYFHSGTHKSMLVDIDFENEKCLLVDKFYRYVGEVKLEDFMKALHSDYNDKDMNNSFQYIKINPKDNIKDLELEILKKHFQTMLEMKENDFVMLNGRKYYRNISGIRSFIDTYDEMAESMMKQKKEYAPLFVTHLLRPIFLQKISYSVLIGYFAKRFNNDILQRISDEANTLSKLWTKVDMLCDKCYLSKNSLVSYKQKYIKVFKEIIKEEEKFFELISDNVMGLEDLKA